MSLVHYCPGSAVGSPAWMSRAEADGYLKEDVNFLEKLIEVDAISKPVYYPHIGGSCPKCRPSSVEVKLGNAK